jgi:NADH:ubiquinone oxidoreductase subunit C
VTEVLARRSRALTPEETEALLRDRLGPAIVGSTIAYGTFTLHVAPGGWVDAVTRCRDEDLLAFDLFDSLFGVDAGDEGFDVVTVLYSTSTGNRLCLRTRCEGGREAPTCPSLAAVFRGADWMERETWDMFGIDFPGHPGLAPRILTVENFEGWPLRKDFPLTSRVVKPWPGVKEPAELDEEGNVIEREVGVGDAPGPYDLDKALAEQALARRRRIEERTGAVAERAAATGASDADDAPAQAADATDDGEGPA